ncbi:AIR synthase family protein [Caldisphaera lagunensis]|uniref:AIR synthase family protein n=1 Tax=Caldisphaera lagunensis TaxID=200415 RepID=UPI001C10DD52
MFALISNKIIGKVNRKLFEDTIYPNLGVKSSDVKVGPQFGVDFGVLRVGDKDLIIEVDPVYIVPEYGWKKSSWFAVHILASDVAVSGIPPKYLFIDLNLPMKMTDDEFKEMWLNIHNECLKLGISIVAGHTGRYEGIDYPMIGGATLIGITDKDNYVSPAMAEPGDLILMTKGPAIETAGILASLFPQVLEKDYGKEFALNAQNIFWLQSVVDDALTLSKLGLRKGVKAMHDATEYGVWGALNDIAEASNIRIDVYKDKLFIREDVSKVLDSFSRFTNLKIDPYASISEGTLIAAISKDMKDEAINLLKERGIEAQIIGEAKEGRGVYLIDGNEKEIKQPEKDDFWPIFYKTLELVKGGKYE